MRLQFLQSTLQSESLYPSICVTEEEREVFQIFARSALNLSRHRGGPLRDKALPNLEVLSEHL